MSGDFFAAYIPLFNPTKPGRREKFISTILTSQDAEQCASNELGDGDCGSLDRYILYCYDLLEKLPYSRDAAIIQPFLDRPYFLISGGPSWGDSPTESYATIAMLVTLNGAYDLFLEWAEEDFRERTMKAEKNAAESPVGDGLDAGS